MELSEREKSLKERELMLSAREDELEGAFKKFTFNLHKERERENIANQKVGMRKQKIMNTRSSR